MVAEANHRRAAIVPLAPGRTVLAVIPRGAVVTLRAAVAGWRAHRLLGHRITRRTGFATGLVAAFASGPRLRTLARGLGSVALAGRFFAARLGLAGVCGHNRSGFNSCRCFGDAVPLGFTATPGLAWDAALTARWPCTTSRF